MKLYEKLKKSITEVQEPLSQGEKNFKALHNPDFKNLVPGVTDQEHLFKGTPQRKDPKTASYEDKESAQAYDKTLSVEEEAEIEEARARTDTYIGTIHKDDPDYDKKVVDMKKQAVGGSRVRGRSPKPEFKHLYKKGGPLHRWTSQDIKPEHGSRVDVYSRKAMKKEEVEQVEEENQYIEVTSKTGAVRHIEVHPSKAFAALNQYKKNGNKARIVSKKPMKEEVEQIDEASIMKHFHGEDGDHGGQPNKAVFDHEKILNHLEKTVGKKHEVYHKVSKLLKSAQRAHHLADKHYDNPDKHMDYKDRAHSDESYAKHFYANHLKSQRSMKKENFEQVDEVLTKKTPVKTWISDFVHSKNPKFAGKSKKQRIKQALGAYYSKQRSEGYVAEKKNDDEDESDRAANKNIINQMRKAPVDGMHKITFENGKKHMIEPKHVAKALEIHANTPVAKGAKEDVQNALGRSHEDFMHVVKHGKAPVVKPRPKVSLGTMRRESVEVNTRESGKGAKEAITVMGADGRPKVKYFTPARKEIKVSEELKGNQHKIDANHNGRVDGQDFKILRGKKKKVQEAEEMTAANVAKAAATQTQFGVVGKENMQQDSIDKMKSDPLASKEKVTLPPTQGNKPIGGEGQTHPNVAEELLNNLYDALSEENKAKFDKLLETEDGLHYLLDFAREQGF